MQSHAEPQIKELAELRIVGIQRPFIHALSPDANNLSVIGGLWNDFMARKSEVADRLSESACGVITFPPKRLRSHPDELLYTCGVPVPQESGIPDGMVTLEIPATTYAVLTHRGPIENIGRTVGWFYREWLPSSEYDHAGIADVEYYDERFQCDSDDSELEYRVSVNKAS